MTYDFTTVMDRRGKDALAVEIIPFPDAEVKVDPACCAGVTPDTHEAALKTMAMCQINVTVEQKNPPLF